jgi:UDP-glucose 4-epimerase
MKVCVTGGAGYIGSHTCLEMLEAGYEVVVMDSLYNATREALNRVEALTGKKVTFYKLDLLDPEGLNKLFTETKFDAVIHFAGLKAVGESVAKPLFYYENNITGTVNLLKAMALGGCKNIVFSSSATVYGDPASVPVKEDFTISATNPYGRTKLFIEEILRDLH